MRPNWNILTSFDSPDFDPFQVFEVDHDSCQLLRVTVLNGEHISMGRALDMLDTPDPYVVLSVPGTNGDRLRTSCVDNCTQPVWNQQFELLYDAERNHVLEVSLVDANIMVDYVIGTTRVDISDLRADEETQIKLTFGEKSAIHLRLKREPSTSPDLRFSLTLCDDEKEFRRQRRQVCMERMNAAFGDEVKITDPLKVPVVAMLGSGGGFRAMIALCGVFKALRDSGLLEMSMYLAGLSGSSWFVSQLYADPRFPDVPTSDVITHFRHRAGVGLLSNLSAQSVVRYMNQLVGKSVQGQPISFTDFFGLLLADTLEGDQQSTLTHMRDRLEGGRAPMPLFTSLHVKKNVSAKVFQEWVEFTPFEIGIPKYGTFMDARKFGSRFFKGKIAKTFPEYPLHFLQGIWGSAFTILFKRLVHKAEGDKETSSDEDEDIPLENLRDLEETVTDGDINADESNPDEEDTVCETENADQVDGDASKDSEFWTKKREQRAQVLTRKKTTLWQGLLDGLMGSNMLNSRAGRAGAVFNPLYGLRMLQSHPLSPFQTPETTDERDETDFSQIKEPMDTDSERLLLVDAGLTFNSPYPVLLRPQRGVDLYISFDFSGRPEDDKDLFKELELAETWARKNQLPFPEVAAQARQFEREPLREVYVFRGDDCPTIMHFVLVNTSFRKFKAPGVPRTTPEELEFADFNVFSGGQQAFGTLNFCYSERDFDRLNQLAEYNTLLHLNLIRDEIKRTIAAKQLTTRMSLRDIIRMKMLSKASKQRFVSLVRALEVQSGTGGDTGAPAAAASAFLSAGRARSQVHTKGAELPTNGTEDVTPSATSSSPQARDELTADHSSEGESRDSAAGSGPKSDLERFESAEDAPTETLTAHQTAEKLHRLLERFMSAQELLDPEEPRSTLDQSKTAS